MKRRAATLAMIVAIMSLTRAGADEGPSILTLMHREFTTSTAPYVVVKKQLAAEKPDWEKIRLASARFVPLAEALARRRARLGDPTSWGRLTGQHLGDVKAMDAAAREGNLEALAAAHRRVAASCKACHAVHKFRPDR